jgi:hypothetical protein
MFLDLHVTTQTYGKAPENAIGTSIITTVLMSGLPWYELAGSKICDADKISRMNNKSYVGRVNKPSERWCHHHVLHSEAFGKCIHQESDLERLR